MFYKLRQFCETHFGFLMSLSLLVGLFSPALGHAPDWAPPAVLALMLMFSYARVDLAHLRHINLIEIGGFYAIRFLLYPLLLFIACAWFLPDYRYAVLLLALLPSAVSAAAMASLMGGHTTLALTGTLLSGVLAPLTIPLAFEWVGMDVAIDTVSMFVTTAILIFVPGVVYFLGFARFPKARDFIHGNAGFASVLLFSVFIIVVVAKLSPQIWAQDVLFLLKSGIVLALVYSSFYVLARLLAGRMSLEKRISYSLLSGCNNVGLGVSLALLYFPARENIYLIICEFLWVFLLAGFKFFLERRQHGV